mmetsp:Transcript_56059/g.87253  ORF Transcript_56059/g.87253 Transcript_56059/m.87253 type:complete len:227 (-) Transcript_56059:952-1632(-)
MHTLGSPAVSKDAASWMMQVVHEPQSASPKTADLHSEAIFWHNSSGHGREKVGFMYRRVSTPWACSFFSMTSRSSDPRALLISIKATGPSTLPLRFAKESNVALSSEVGLRTVLSSRVDGPGDGTSSEAGRGSTRAVTGWFMNALAIPRVPIPNPGMKHENFPAGAPATAIWNDSGLVNFGIFKNGIPTSRMRPAMRKTIKPAIRNNIFGPFGIFSAKACVMVQGK